MLKEKDLRNFLLALNIVLRNSTVYFPEHPSFIKSLDEFKLSLKKAVPSQKALTVGVSDKAFFIEGKEYFANDTILSKLAHHLHIRKIKHIEFLTPQIPDKQLKDFILLLALPYQQINQAGGIVRLMREKGISAVLVEELDYRAFLGGKGTEIKTIWNSLFKEKIFGPAKKVAVNNFSLLVDEVAKRKELLANNNFIGNFLDLAFSFKETHSLEDVKEKMVNLYVNLGDNISSNLREKFQQLLLGMGKDLDENTISKLVLNLLPDKEQHNFLRKILQNAPLKAREKTFPLVIKSMSTQDVNLINKLKSIFSQGEKSQFLDESYQGNISYFSQDMDTTANLLLSLDETKRIYFATLINLLYMSTSSHNIYLICKSAEQEYTTYLNMMFFKEIKAFLQLLEIKRKEGFDVKEGVFGRRLFNYIISGIRTFDDETFSTLLSLLEERYVNLARINGIFVNTQENKIKLRLIQLMFKAQITDYTILEKEIRKNVRNISYMENIIKISSVVNNSAAVYLLGKIFSYAQNPLIRLTAARALANTSPLDIDFFLHLAKARDYELKKLAFSVLSRNYSSAVKKFLEDYVFSVDYYGFRLKEVIANLKLAKEEGFSELKEIAAKLLHKRLLWGRERLVREVFDFLINADRDFLQKEVIAISAKEDRLLRKIAEEYGIS